MNFDPSQPKPPYDSVMLGLAFTLEVKTYTLLLTRKFLE